MDDRERSVSAELDYDQKSHVAGPMLMRALRLAAAVHSKREPQAQTGALAHTVSVGTGCHLRLESKGSADL